MNVEVEGIEGVSFETCADFIVNIVISSATLC